VETILKDLTSEREGGVCSSDLRGGEGGGCSRELGLLKVSMCGTKYFK